MSYLTLIRYGLPALVLLTIGMWLGFHLEKGHYDGLQREYSAYRLQVSQEHEAGQKAAADALEAQIAARNATEVHNAQIIQTLQNRAASSAADLARANRLLELAAQDSSCRRPVPQTADQPGTAAASQASGASDLTGLLVATKDECSDNADRLDALIAEIKPQL